MQPVLFLSHGTEDNYSSNTSYNDFLIKLSAKLNIRKPDSIIILSSLWNSDNIIVGTNLNKEIIHQNYVNKFNEKIIYSPPNAIIFSKKIESLIYSNNLIVKTENKGYDFGVWSILNKLFPEANIPIIQLSIPQYKNLEDFFHLGKILQTFSQKNVLIIVSGGLVYNLKRYLKLLNNKEFKDEQHYQIEPLISWVNHCLIENDLNLLFDYRRKAPNIDLLDEEDLIHFNSLFIALGAASPSGLKRLHYSIEKSFSYECFISKVLIN